MAFTVVPLKMSVFIGLQPYPDSQAKKTPDEPGFVVRREGDYMRAIIASPKAEQETSVAPSISRAKS